MKRAGLSAAALALVLWTAAAGATPVEDATRLYNKGEFLAAATAAQNINTAAGLALAARAVLAHAIYVAKPSQRTEEYRRGEELASKALTLDPKNVEAHLQMSVAIYHRSRTMSPVEAFFRGLPDAALAHLNTALSIDRKNPWAYSLLGGWHFESVRLGGSFLAATLLGASLEEGRAAFDKANRLMPRSITLQYSFARTLLMNDPVANRAEAVQALETVLAGKPATYVEELTVARARAIRDAVGTYSPGDLLDALESQRL